MSKKSAPQLLEYIQQALEDKRETVCSGAAFEWHWGVFKARLDDCKPKDQISSWEWVLQKAVRSMYEGGFGRLGNVVNVLMVGSKVEEREHWMRQIAHTTARLWKKGKEADLCVFSERVYPLLLPIEQDEYICGVVECALFEQGKGQMYGVQGAKSTGAQWLETMRRLGGEQNIEKWMQKYVQVMGNEGDNWYSAEMVKTAPLIQCWNAMKEQRQIEQTLVEHIPQEVQEQTGKSKATWMRL